MVADCTELDKDGFRIYRIPGLHKTKSTAVSRKSEMRPVSLKFVLTPCKHSESVSP